MEEALQYILERMQEGENNLKKLKIEAAGRFGLKQIPKNSELLAYAKQKGATGLLLQLKKRPMRTRSGVTPIAVMIKPQGSCHWGCIYCPFTGRAAKSYTGEEPAALRARDNHFDPYLQAQARIKQFESCGHPTEKCEVIVMGGTFLAMDPEYKNYFIKNIYDALNEKESEDIAHAKKINETAKHRVVGLTIETRPDTCVQHIDEIVGYGATRVELGVQHPDDAIYAKTNRGHATKEVIESTRELKNCAFKVLYHLMPGLPGSNPEKDIGMVQRIFEDERFKPDMLKIYPTLVIPGTKLYEMMQRGEYTPYSSEAAAEVISEFYRSIPKYVRVMRIQRDIPATNIAEGVKKSNLREMVEEAVRRKGINVQEIRYREIGWKRNKGKGPLELQRLDYEASGGKEIFLSFENENCIAGFLRLRIMDTEAKSLRGEIDGNCALVRELHVYGDEVPLQERGGVQHQGLGSQLLLEAERIAKEEFDKKRMVIISGVGVREYYYKRDYALTGSYVGKML